MRKARKNVPASVHARLRAGAQGRREDFNLTLKRYAAERFLYRLGASPHREQFVLKGAMLFALWGGSMYRATRDLDLAGYTENDSRALVAIMQKICAVECPGDGLTFQAATVRAEPIRDKSEYHGFRVKLEALLGTARPTLEIDVGFGNAIEPPAHDEEYPVLLDGPAPRIRAYPREAVVAEKVHAMVVLGAANSRHKDFYDVLVLATHFAFSGTSLTRAIAATFERRRTPFPSAQPIALTSAFYSDPKRAADWQRYLSRNTLPGAPADFGVVGELLQAFLRPLWSALAANRPFSDSWPHAGPWTPPVPEQLAGAGVVSGAKQAERAAAVARFKPYPAYKDSGVEWLGEIPAHWDTAKTWRICHAISGATPAKEERGYWDGDIPWVSPKDMKRRFIESSEDTITERAVAETGIKLIAPPAVLIVVRGMILAHTFPVAITNVAVTINQDMKALHLRRDVEPVFIAWLFEGVGKGILGAVVEEAAHGTRVIRMDRWRSVVVPVPPIDEQRAIAAFLDRETARIDALAAKKERLIELLHEKRTALITRAVTKGLDPNVSMKDSGVEWLGKIPGRWEVKPIRSLAKAGYKTFTDGDWIESPFIREEGIRLIQTGNIGIGAYREQGFRYVDEETFRAFRCTEVIPNDVLICRLADPVGRACLAPELGCRMITSVDVCILKPEPDIDPAFLVYALSGAEYLAWLGGICRGGTRDRVSRSMLGGIRVQKPPLEEQRAIAASLDRETVKIDALVARVRDAIDRLKELRSTLISAAVTGKIDVREVP